MLSTGEAFPTFNLKAVVSSSIEDAFTEINHQSHPDKWRVYFFWPMDFTFVCPTEIAEFGRLNSEFTDRDSVLLGASTDSEFVHLAFRQQKQELADLPFPRLADVKRELSQALGILDKNAGVAQRATFIIDPLGLFDL